MRSSTTPEPPGGEPETDRRRILVTMGDPAGVGPEVALACLADPEVGDPLDVTLVGERAVFDECASSLSLPRPGTVIEPGPFGLHYEPGRATLRGARAALDAVETAARLCLAGDADAMVTGPVSKAAITEAGVAFSGHTEFLAELTGADVPLMLFVAGPMRVALATTHIALADVPGAVTREGLVARLRVLSRGLSGLLGIEGPRLAVVALNPHAGEGGRFGDEEERVILPAIEAARSEGIAASGPHPADTIFCGLGDASCSLPGAAYDAALAMYHDQGVVPVKLAGFGRAVNVTLGLPIIRTSVDHGTAFDIAGRGKAEAGSMKAAVRLAGSMAGRRAADPDEGAARPPA
ncbi:MAG: 4-hydroxythreonine-4-phosphate dehydrogenase PdxA [Candidatus Eisenbacteria bacterium]|nr:4-hydroxythreonine-4-phosphate dehydrogenase PdxA [Candidatus Eisenbacteria bacterium]